MRDQRSHSTPDASNTASVVEAEKTESDDDRPVDPETRATLDSIRANLDAWMADVTGSRTGLDTEPTGGIETDAPRVCKLRRGCRYSGCPEKGRCLGHQSGSQQRDEAAA